MDWSSEKYPWLSLWLGIALVFAWGVMSLAQAYDRSIATVSDSFNHGFMLLSRVEAVIDALNRLGVEQRAFLSTGDENFQDPVIESAEALEIDMDILHSLTTADGPQYSLLTALPQSISRVLDLVGESDSIRDAHGGAAAAAFFQSRDDTLAFAKCQAEQLKIEITRGMSERIRKARDSKVLFEAIFQRQPAPMELGSSVAFQHSLRLAAARPWHSQCFSKSGSGFDDLV